MNEDKLVQKLKFILKKYGEEAMLNELDKHLPPSQDEFKIWQRIDIRLKARGK